MSLARAWPVLLVVAFLAPPRSGSETERPQRPPVYSSQVSLVLLPVFVADPHGRALRGLRAEDFVVEEDGKRVEIVSLRYVDTTATEEQDAIRQASAARRRFLLLFDKSFTDLGGLNRAQRAAMDFVRKGLAESDLAAVATFDVNRGLQVVANFTEDRGLLAHAVETLGVPRLSRISDPLGLAADMVVTDIALPGASDATPDAILNNVLSVLVRQLRSAEDRAYRSNVMTLVANLRELARGLRGVEGRKQVLYFSAGFDSRVLIGETGRDQREAAQSIAEGRLWEVDGLNRYGDTRVRDALTDATRILASADAVVHAIDVTGLGTDDSLTRTRSPEESQRTGVAGRESLNLLAEETGGRFFRDTNDLRSVLNEMADMTSRFYVLGFQPLKEKGPGAYHKVKVKVDRKGAKLSHRAGYYEKMPLAGQPALQRQFEAAQLVMTGVGQDDLRFSALCLPFPAPGQRQTLSVVIQVPKDAVPWSRSQPLALEFYGYGVAEDGTVMDHFAQLARIDLAQADPEGTVEGLSLFGTLSVPPGRYTVRLMVHERASGSAGVEFFDVTVPPYDARRGFLLPPLVMDEPSRWLMVQAGRGGVSAGVPFQVAGQPFVPRASFRLDPGRAQKMVLIAYDPALPGDPAADLQIRSSLTDRDGRPVPAGFLRVQKVHHEAEGRHTYVLGYTPEVSEPGEYTLRIGLGEAGSLLQSYALLRLRKGGL